MSYCNSSTNNDQEGILTGWPSLPSDQGAICQMVDTHLRLSWWKAMLLSWSQSWVGLSAQSVIWLGGNWGIQEILMASAQSMWLRGHRSLHQPEMIPVRRFHDHTLESIACPDMTAYVVTSNHSSPFRWTSLPLEGEVSRFCQPLLCKVLLDSSSEITFEKHFKDYQCLYTHHMKWWISTWHLHSSMACTMSTFISQYPVMYPLPAVLFFSPVVPFYFHVTHT